MAAIGHRAGGRPTREQAAAIDMLVLDGARAAFCAKGIASTSIEEIALRLGVSKHTIYRRYANKAALLDAVVERDIRHFRTALVAASAHSADPLDALRRTALRYFEFGASRDYSAFYLSVNAEAAVSPSLRKRLALWSGMALEPLQAAIASARAEGSLCQEDPAAICEILVDLLEGANNRVRLHGDGELDSRSRRRLFDHRWAVFLAALGRT